MPSGGTEYDYLVVSDFSGGINCTVSPIKIQDNQMYDCLNFYLDTTGALVKRSGYAKENVTDITQTGGTGIDNIHRYYHPSQNYLMACAKTTTEYHVFKKASTTWSELTGGTALAVRPLFFQTYRDKLFMYNGANFEVWEHGEATKADVAWYVSGTAYEANLQPKMLLVSDDRMWIVNNNSANDMYFSEYAGWSGTSGLKFPKGWILTIPERVDDDSSATGIQAWISWGAEDSLYVFRAGDIWKVSGVDENDYSLTKISGVVGCISRKGLCETAGGAVIFIGKNQVYEMTSEGITAIGTPIQTFLATSAMTDSFCTYDLYKDSVYIRTGTETLVWNCKTRGWTRFGINCNNWVVYNDISSAGYTVISFADSLALYRMHQGKTDLAKNDGTSGVSILTSAIFKTLDTTPYAGDGFGSDKTFHALKFLADVDTTDAFYYSANINRGKISEGIVKFNTMGTTWNSSLYDVDVWSGTDLQVGTAQLPDGRVGNWIRVGMFSTDSNSLTIYGYAVEITTKHRRRVYPTV